LNSEDVKIEQEFSITPLMQRGIAKIAMNYLTSRQGTEFALLPAFDPIRRFARYGELPHLPRVDLALGDIRAMAAAGPGHSVSPSMHFSASLCLPRRRRGAHPVPPVCRFVCQLRQTQRIGTEPTQPIFRRSPYRDIPDETKLNAGEVNILTFNP